MSFQQQKLYIIINTIADIQAHNNHAQSDFNNLHTSLSPKVGTPVSLASTTPPPPPAPISNQSNIHLNCDVLYIIPHLVMSTVKYNE